MAPVLWVAIGGGLGALLRHGATVWLRAPGHAPSWRGTAVANLAGAFLAGWLAGQLAESATLEPARDPVVLLVGIGFLGALTTFSTWMLEAVDLARSGARAASAAHVMGLLAAGVLLAWLGLSVGLAIGR